MIIGILQRATDAKTNTDNAQIKERIQLAYHSALTKDITGENGELTIPTLQEELNNEFVGKTVTITPSTDNKEWKIKVDDVEVNVTAGKVVIDRTKDKNGVKIASSEQTTPWLPTADTEITNNDLTTGLTIKDKNQNEWVWIEVPKSVTASATLDNPTSIKEVLEHYVYETNAKGENSPLLTKGTSSGDNKTTTKGYTDVNHTGTGLDDGQYSEKYSAMLKSIKANGGFYIGKYEVGYKESDKIRQESSKGNTSNNAPVIQVDAYPYNWVTNAEAESLSETLTTGMASTQDKKASLMFGIQWDLVLKYLNEKGGLSVADITSKDSSVGSSNWGNYYQNNLNVTNTNAMEYPLSTNTWSAVVNGKKTQGPPSLLTTGSSTEVEKLNIYDLAGNVFEWTLEKASDDSYPCALRGGFFTVTGSSRPASYRNSSIASLSDYVFGFRPTLY